MYIEVDSNFQVIYQCLYPENLKDVSKGFIVNDELPKKEYNDKFAVLHYSLEKGYWYEYISHVVSDSQMIHNLQLKMDDLKDENISLKGLIADLGLQIGGGL